MSSSFDPRLTPARADLAADFLRGAIEAADYAKGVAKCVIAPSAPVHSAPDFAAGKSTELLMGEGFIVYEEKNGWAWDVELLQNPDRALASTENIVVSSDSVVLDKCGRWCNVARYIIEQQIKSARIVDLSGKGNSTQ